MIKKTIKYRDYENVEREEDFYFNLSRAEIIEMEYGVQGGLTKKLEGIAKSNDPTQIIPMFKDIILKSYGKKSDDGKRFIKSPALSEEFSQTEAYSELVLELISDENKASEFVNGLITGVGPIDKDMIEKAKAGANISALPAAKS
jgi:hypothetical protein